VCSCVRAYLQRQANSSCCCCTASRQAPQMLHSVLKRMHSPCPGCPVHSDTGVRDWSLTLQPGHHHRGGSGDSHLAAFAFSDVDAILHMDWAADGSMCGITTEVRRGPRMHLQINKVVLQRVLPSETSTSMHTLAVMAQSGTVISAYAVISQVECWLVNQTASTQCCWLKVLKVCSGRRPARAVCNAGAGWGQRGRPRCCADLTAGTATVEDLAGQLSWLQSKLSRGVVARSICKALQSVYYWSCRPAAALKH
jgi:hypothetical protein